MGGLQPKPLEKGVRTMEEAGGHNCPRNPVTEAQEGETGKEAEAALEKKSAQNGSEFPKTHRGNQSWTQ